MSTTQNSVLIYEFWFPWDVVNCLQVYCILVAILQFMLWKENELTDAGVKKSKPQSLKDLVIDYSANMFTCLLSPNSDHMMIHLLAYNCAIWQWRLCMRVCPNRTVVISQWIITWSELGGNWHVNTLAECIYWRGAQNKDLKWLLINVMSNYMKFMFHKGIQGNLEGNSSNLTEATSGLFFQAPLQLS